jgi:hypothetical protein
VVAGTAQKCRINPDEPSTKGGWPAAPEWLFGRASAIFEETCRRMSGMGTLSEEWADMIADYASYRGVEITTGIIEDLTRTKTSGRGCAS